MLQKTMLLLMMMLFVVTISACGSSNDVDGDIDGDGENVSDGDEDNTESSDGDMSEDGDLDDSGENDVDDFETVDGDEEYSGEEEMEADEEITPLVCSEIWTEALTDVWLVTGKAVDENGDDLQGATVVFCVFQDTGVTACLNPVTTDSDGFFSIDVPTSRRCMKSAAIHVVHYDESRAGVYCEVELLEGGELDTGEYMLASVPASTRDSLGVTTDVHEIKAADGTTLSVVPDNMYLWDYGYEDINVLVWDDSLYGWPCFIDAANPPEALVALTPEIEFGDGNASTSRNDAVHLAFVNSSALPANTVVNLWGLGGTSTKKHDGTKVDEGVWEIIGEAKVTEDETMITTISGEGLPFFTWFGWTEKE